MNGLIVLMSRGACLLLLAVAPTTAGASRAPLAAAGPRHDFSSGFSADQGLVALNPFRIGDQADEIGTRLLAHAILVKSSPEREATINDVPDEVLLIFNDAVGEEFLALAVIDESGRRVDQHDAKLDFTDRSHLRATVSKLLPGRYTVRYRVLSADGHVVSGKYFFQVQGP